jgi:hypothetical protein
MSEPLSSFLVDLATNPGLMSQFMADPLAVLASTALTADEKAAILSRDPRRLSASLGVDYLTAASVSNDGRGHGDGRGDRGRGDRGRGGDRGRSRGRAGRKASRKSSRKSGRKKKGR